MAMGANSKKNLKYFLISILAVALAFYLYATISEIIFVSKAHESKKSYRTAIIILYAYKEQCGKYPTTEQGLTWLTKRHECYAGELLKNEYLKNSYNKEYIYFSDGNNFRLISLGEDGFDIDESKHLK